MCALCRHRSRYTFGLKLSACVVSFPHIYIVNLSLTLAYRSILDDSSSRARLVDTQHQPVDGRKNSIYNVLNFALLFFPLLLGTLARAFAIERESSISFDFSDDVRCVWTTTTTGSAGGSEQQGRGSEGKWKIIDIIIMTQLCVGGRSILEKSKSVFHLN